MNDNGLNGEKVVITEKEYDKAEEIFRQAKHCILVPVAPDEETVTEAVRRVRARMAIVGSNRYSGPLYSALKEAGAGRGSLLVRFGVGHDGVDKALVRQNGLILCNTPGVLDESVAEHTLWLIGNLARHIPAAEARMRAGEFAGEAGMELHGKRLCVLGFGNIGRRVASIARFGFGMSVRAGGASSVQQLEAREKRSINEIEAAFGLERYTHRLEELLCDCDFLSLHLPATPATRHLINSESLGWLKPGARLVNTGRGSLVDEVALYEALAGGKLAGAALDVFEHEPYQPVADGMDLRRLPNVVLTPHIGSNTREANRRMGEASLANVESFLAGDHGRLTRVQE
jgi:lactate dehydrogenase-like 2-hydroxyacid dehydrogenase